LTGETNYYSFRASSDLRIIFQIENSNKLIILDITRSPYSRARKTFRRLFVISLVVFAIFIFLGTAGSKFFHPKFFIAIVATNPPTSTPTGTPPLMVTSAPTGAPSLTVIFTPTGTPTLTSTPAPYGTRPYTLTYTPTASATPTKALSIYTLCPTYTPYPTNTLPPTATSTRVPMISNEVISISGWVFGTATSCLTTIIAFIGLISTTLLTWKKEAREAEFIKLDYRKIKIELEKMQIELEKLKKQKTRKVRK